MPTKMRASGRVRAVGINKVERKLMSRRSEWSRLSSELKPAFREPGTRKKLD